MIIADDESIYRIGLRDFLEPEFDIIGEARTGQEAIHQTLQRQPDVVILDMDMPGVDGVAAAKRIRESCPDTGVVLVTAHDDDRTVFEAIKAGAVGYVHRHDDPQLLMQAVENAAGGAAYLPPAVTKRVLDAVAGLLASRTDGPEQTVTSLSHRELEVLRLIAEGKRNREIAEELAISERTVSNHVTNIYDKLGISDRSQILVYAIKKGILRV